MSKTWKDGKVFMVIPAEFCPEENVTMPPVPAEIKRENEGRVLRMEPYTRSERRAWKEDAWNEAYTII